LLRLGPFPSESAGAAQIAERQGLLARIAPPLSLAEAAALAGILGPDDCFGLAWSVVHLIESAPGWSARHIPLGPSPFLPLLRVRVAHA
jgi:hypothetical protein